MPVADEDLRHGASPRKRHHRGALRGIEIDANVLDGLDAALLQQCFGMNAVGAHLRAVHLDRLHAVHTRVQAADFSTGRFAARHASKPPASARALAKPSCFSVATALLARAPVGHTTTSGSALFFGSSFEPARLASGTLREPAA